MKSKGIFAAFLAVFLGFIIAISLCVETLSQREVFAYASPLKVVVDAGHGGIDGGVTGKKTGVKESDLNLKISLLICEKLGESGFDATLTRKTKEGLYDTTAKGFKRRDMAKRKEIIERENPALVLSVHQNFFPSSAQRGGQVFYLKGDEEDTRLAGLLQTRLNALYEKEGVKNRKSMAADYYILAASPCPAALIECGFLSSEKDEKLLSDPAFLDDLTAAICAGVVDYLFALA